MRGKTHEQCFLGIQVQVTKKDMRKFDPGDYSIFNQFGVERP